MTPAKYAARILGLAAAVFAACAPARAADEFLTPERRFQLWWAFEFYPADYQDDCTVHVNVTGPAGHIFVKEGRFIIFDEAQIRSRSVNPGLAYFTEHHESAPSDWKGFFSLTADCAAAVPMFQEMAHDLARAHPEISVKTRRGPVTDESKRLKIFSGSTARRSIGAISAFSKTLKEPVMRRFGRRLWIGRRITSNSVKPNSTH